MIKTYHSAQYGSRLLRPTALNLQPIGSLAKAYQVRQVRTVILKYKLGDLHGG